MNAFAHETTPGGLMLPVARRLEAHEVGMRFPACEQAPHRDTRKETGPVVRDETVACGPARQPATTWPLTSYLELAALPTAVPCFRLHSRAVAFEWGLAVLAENIELIVSELVTNAIRIAQRPRVGDSTVAVVRLWLTSDLHSMVIRVWDGGTAMPVRQDARPEDESGRGLMLVDCLASEWGVDRRQNGKVVWVIVK
jgi:anti-sigma regulatory factor (Ser/Thr protein kinase)